MDQVPSPLQTPAQPVVPPASQPTMPSPVKAKNSAMLYVAIAVVICIIVAFAVFLVLPSSRNYNQSIKPLQQTTSPMPTSSSRTNQPTIAPMTTENEDQTLGETDVKIQQTMDQVDTDMSDLNKVDQSQDSTYGL